MPDLKNKKTKEPKKVDTTLADNMKMVLEKHIRQNNQPIQNDPKIFDNKFKKTSVPQKDIGSDFETPAKMKGSPLYGKISSACKAAAKKKFKVWPSAYASGWGVRCTKAGGPSKFGGGKNKK